MVRWDVHFSPHAALSYLFVLSAQAQAIAVTVIFTIVVSTMSFIIETLPAFHRRDEEVWTTIEAVCIGLFTIELRLTLLFFWRFFPRTRTD